MELRQRRFNMTDDYGMMSRFSMPAKGHIIMGLLGTSGGRGDNMEKARLEFIARNQRAQLERETAEHRAMLDVEVHKAKLQASKEHADAVQSGRNAAKRGYKLEMNEGGKFTEQSVHANDAAAAQARLDASYGVGEKSMTDIAHEAEGPARLQEWIDATYKKD
jgi:hypothetical protein